MAQPEVPVVERNILSTYLFIPGESRLGDYGVERLGAKAHESAELQELGLPIPEFIVLTTDAWRTWNSCYEAKWLNEDKVWLNMDDQRRDLIPQIPFNIWGSLLTGVREMEKRTGNVLNDSTNPLFVSVRSGAPESLPGAMHTILNVGINFDTVHALADNIGERNAWYAFFTLIRELGAYALNIPEDKFTQLRDATVGHNPKEFHDIPDYHKLVLESMRLFKEESGIDFPLDAVGQLRWAIDSVFRSWASKEAVAMRRSKKIWSGIGTAVIVQKMTFGNSIEEGAGSGVFFTRNPITYEGDPSSLENSALCVFERGGQGIKVVQDTATHHNTSLSQINEKFRPELERIITTIREHYTHPMEGEFTIDGEKLSLLQARKVSLSSLAHFRFIREQMQMDRMKEKEAKLLVSAAQLRRIIAPGLDQEDLERARNEDRLIGQGISLSPGWSSGVIVRSIEEAKFFKKKKVIFVGRVTKSILEKKTDNIMGFVSDKGSIGSHISRRETEFDDQGVVVINGIKIPATILKDKDAVITLNGETGEVFNREIKVSTNTGPLTQLERQQVLRWQRERRDNPWLFVMPQKNIQSSIDHASDLLHAAKRTIRSPKGRVIQVSDALLPQEIRMKYQVFPIGVNKKKLLDLGNEILESGFDLSIRSCPLIDEEGKGKSPYAYITSKEELKKFIYSFDGLFKWKMLKHPQLTEIVLGRIPKGKLDETLCDEHCAWTLSCTHDSVILNVVPFTPLLRSHEKKRKDDMMTLVLHVDHNKGGRLVIDRLIMGRNLQKEAKKGGDEQEKINIRSYEFLSYVASEVFGKWWNQYNIPGLMAALTTAFPRTQYYPLAFEGQARIAPNGSRGKKMFCLGYGIKADRVKRSKKREG